MTHIPQLPHIVSCFIGSGQLFSARIQALWRCAKFGLPCLPKALAGPRDSIESLGVLSIEGQLDRAMRMITEI